MRGMRLFLSLLGIVVAGVGLSLAPTMYLPFISVAERGWAADTWVRCVGLFAIPLSLSLLGLWRSELVRWMDIAWGLWIALLSMAVLWNARSPFSCFHSWRAFLYVLTVLVLSLATILFASMSIARPRKI